MTRVLVAWEDTNYQSLAEAVNIVVRKLAPAGSSARPTALHHTARSNSAFDRYIETTWPSASLRGLPMNPGPIEHVICVVDADKLSDLLSQQISYPSTSAKEVVEWHAAAEEAWSVHLRDKCPLGGPPTNSVHGVVLRWSKESAVLSGYDQAPFASDLDCDIASPELKQFLARCQPSPPRLSDDDFANHYRNPTRCLRELRRAARRPELPKNAPQFDDVLRKLGRQHLATLRSRTPDLTRIAQLIWKLHAASEVGPFR